MKVFSIPDYGANFCYALQIAPIQKAINDCFLAGGGKAIIPGFGHRGDWGKNIRNFF